MRIVSLVPSHTETLHGLGLADQVVGRTRFCIHPSPWVDAIPHVGGTKDASLDKILALEPDLVVADKDENPKALVDSLEDAGVMVLWSAIDTVPDAAEFILELGRVTSQEDKARRAAGEIHATLADVAAPADVPVFCPIWHPWMTFDDTAYPHAMLEAVGLRNVFGDHDGPKYFEVEEEEVRARGAEWVLLPTEPFPFHRKDVDTSGLVAKDHAVVIDGEALTWFGTRTVQGLRELAQVRRRITATRDANPATRSAKGA